MLVVFVSTEVKIWIGCCTVREYHVHELVTQNVKKQNQVIIPGIARMGWTELSSALVFGAIVRGNIWGGSSVWTTFRSSNASSIASLLRMSFARFLSFSGDSSFSLSSSLEVWILYVYASDGVYVYVQLTEHTYHYHLLRRHLAQWESPIWQLYDPCWIVDTLG